MKPDNAPGRLDVRDVHTPSKPIKTAVKQATTSGVGKAKPVVAKPPGTPVVDRLSRDPLPPPVIVPKVPVYSIAGISKLDQTQYEQFSADFARNTPRIIMIVDYIIDGIKVGNLILFHKYKSSSHYEIFKKNIFADISTFQRTLFIDAHSLLEETARFNDYIRKHIGMDNLALGSYYAVMDPLIKDDRIYEYKIMAARVPQSSKEVDYDYILESKNLLNSVSLDSIVQRTLAEFSVSTLGSKQFGWIIALLNRRLSFFNTTTLTTPLGQLVAPDTKVIFPKNLNYIKRIMDDSVSLFGLDQTISHIISLLGGLSTDFKDSFNKSLSAVNKTFSYAAFIASIRSKVPVFSLFLQISEHAKNAEARTRLSQLNLTLPVTNGVASYITIEGLSNIFDFINSIIFLVTRSQDNSATLVEILAELNKPPPPPPPLAAKPAAPIQKATLPVRPTVVVPPQTASRFPAVSKTLNGARLPAKVFIKPR
jgi:hypothetical protein